MSDAFFARLGATHLVRSVCGSAGGTGIAMTIGDGPGFLPEDLVHSRYIILWGTNTISTNLHLWPFIRQAKEQGATIVVIDPAKTRTAAAADHPRPPDAGDGCGAGARHDARDRRRRACTTSATSSEHTVGFEQVARTVAGLRARARRRDHRDRRRRRSVTSRARTPPRAPPRSACSSAWSTTRTVRRRSAPSAACPPSSERGATAAAVSVT